MRPLARFGMRFYTRYKDTYAEMCGISVVIRDRITWLHDRIMMVAIHIALLRQAMIFFALVKPMDPPDEAQTEAGAIKMPEYAQDPCAIDLYGPDLCLLYYFESHGLLGPESSVGRRKAGSYGTPSGLGLLVLSAI